MSSDQQLVELRGMCPRWVVDVLDAVSTADKTSRNELVVQILQQWAEHEIHKATLIARVSRGNGSHAEGAR